MTIVLLYVTSGCRKQDMAEQPRFEPMEPSTFYDDGQSARPLVPGTVPRGGSPVGQPVYAVTSTGAEADRFPFQLTAADLERGRQQFNVYCSVCHGQLGRGDGMIVQRGFTPPPSFYVERLRRAPVGHFYNVITNGYGAMYSYNDRVSPDDRWRIAGHVRALQLSSDERPAEPARGMERGGAGGQMRR
jgi:mono/diheme cytochrome c family protein